MKKNKKDIIILVIVLLLSITLVIIPNFVYKTENNKENNYEIDNNNKTSDEIEQEYNENKEKLIIYQDQSTIDQLKKEYNISGDNELYQIETEKDGRKVINVKPSINYKVAFSGMIEEKMPSLEEIDRIFDKKYPQKSGIWINENSRKKIVHYLNNNSRLKANYYIDKEGYLQQNDEKRLTEIDKKVKKLIDSSKQYIISVASKCFMVDAVTGKIIEYRYNDLDTYQTYEYFEDKDKMLIFISENKENKLKEDEIFESVIKLLEL